MAKSRMSEDQLRSEISKINALLKKHNEVSRTQGAMKSGDIPKGRKLIQRRDKLKAQLKRVQGSPLGNAIAEGADWVTQAWKDAGDVTKLNETETIRVIKKLENTVKFATSGHKKAAQTQLADAQKHLNSFKSGTAAKPAAAKLNPRKSYVLTEGIKPKPAAATSKAGEVEGNVKGEIAAQKAAKAVPKPKPRPRAITKKDKAAAYEPEPHNLGRAPEGYLRGFIDTQPPDTRPIPGSSDDTGAVSIDDMKAAARKRRALREKLLERTGPNAPRPSETAGSLQTQIKKDLSAGPPKIIKEKKSAKSKSSWSRVKDDGGPNDRSQGKRVYNTPFGRVTVDSTDEGMFPDEYGGDSKDRSNLRKGGTTKKKASSKKKAAPVQKYGFRQGGFTARGGMYKVKG